MSLLSLQVECWRVGFTTAVTCEFALSFTTSYYNNLSSYFLLYTGALLSSFSLFMLSLAKEGQFYQVGLVFLSLRI